MLGTSVTFYWKLGSEVAFQSQLSALRQKGSFENILNFLKNEDSHL